MSSPRAAVVSKKLASALDCAAFLLRLASKLTRKILPQSHRTTNDPMRQVQDAEHRYRLKGRMARAAGEVPSLAAPPRLQEAERGAPSVQNLERVGAEDQFRAMVGHPPALQLPGGEDQLHRKAQMMAYHPQALPQLRDGGGPSATAMAWHPQALQPGGEDRLRRTMAYHLQVLQQLRSEAGPHLCRLCPTHPPHRTCPHSLQAHSQSASTGSRPSAL